MNLHNFHKQISRKIYERGEEYYEEDTIENVEHNSPDTWTAEVEGSDVYSVEIKLNGDEIVSWDCDCPYDYGDICKHVVAVLLYIKNHRDEYPVAIEIPLSEPQEQLSEILKQTKDKELISFLSDYADKNPDFYQALQSNLHPKKKTTTPTDYSKEIQKCFRHSSERYDYRHSSGRYDYRNEGQTIAVKLDNYIEKARSLVKLDCQEQALTILLLIIKEIGDDYEELDDYDGDLACVCQDAIDVIVEMVESGLSDDLLRELTDEITPLIKNSSYANYDLGDLNELLFSISLKTADFDNGIRIVDEALQNEQDSFRTPSLVRTKIELLEKAGKTEEVTKVITSYLYLSEIRRIRLKELMDAKDFESALTLIDEGISVAEKKERPGTVADWTDEKMSVYRLMGNKAKVIELAEYLFVHGRESMKYYHTLKTVIPSNSWAEYLDTLLIKSAKQHQWGLEHVYAKIYIEEKYWDRLMNYVEKNVRLGKYTSLAEYERHLKTRYPERMLAFYEKQITDYAAKNMGRDHYKYVADVLTKMKTYPDGDKTVEGLLTHFKSTYPKRRAMMEELGAV